MLFFKPKRKRNEKTKKRERRKKKKKEAEKLRRHLLQEREIYTVDGHTCSTEEQKWKKGDGPLI